MPESATSQTQGRHGAALFSIPLFVLLLLRLAASLFPGHGWWGMDYTGYLPPWQLLLITAAALLTALPGMASFAGTALQRLADRLFPASPAAERTTHLALALGFGALAYIVTMPYPFLGGDGVHVMRRLFRFNAEAMGTYGQLSTEPLTVLLFSWLAKLSSSGTAAGSSVDLTGYTALFRFVGAAGAAMLTFAALRFSAFLTSDRTERLALLSMLLFTGGTLLYFGYVEFYAPVFTAGALFLLSGMRSIHGKKQLLVPALALLLALTFHFSAVAFIPAFLFLLATPGQDNGEVRSTRVAWYLQVGVFLLALAGMVLVYAADVQGPWIALFPQAARQTMFSATHLRDVLNNVLLTAPLAVVAILMVVPMLRRRVFSTPPVLAFTSLAALWWFGLIVSQPAFALDWDIFPVFGLALACSAWILLTLLPAGKRRSYLATQMIIQPLLFFLPWLLLHINQDAAVERYAALTESYTGTLPPTVIAGFHETLRSEAVTRASGVEEIRQIAVMIELTGESYEYVKLLRAISREGYGVEGGTQDVRRMLQRLTLQSDSVLDIPVGEDADAQRMTLRGLYPSLITAMGVALPPRERIAWLEASVAPAARLGRPFAILAQLGHLAFDARAYPRAASWYEKAILDSLSAPDDGGVMLSLIHSNLGIIQFDAEPPAALASFLHATTYPGASAVAWSNLGFAYFRTARFAESEKSFVVTLRMDSSNVNALYCLGRLSVGRRETHASGLWLLQRFLALERNTMRSKDLARWLASM